MREEPGPAENDGPGASLGRCELPAWEPGAVLPGAHAGGWTLAQPARRFTYFTFR